MSDPNQATFRRVEDLLLEGLAARARGAEPNRHTAAFLQKIQPLLPEALRRSLLTDAGSAETAAKLRLELSLLAQRPVFLVHAVLFLDAFDRDLAEEQFRI